MLDTATGQAETENTSTPNSAPLVQLPVDLRDWFAGQACVPMVRKWVDESVGDPDGIAADAYRLADAMLKARAAK